MKLFHGSNKIIEKPQYNGSRDKTDFGKGFYLTPNENQARRWSIKGTENIVNCYDLNLKELKVYEFELGLEWLLFIIFNRKIGDFNFDIVEERFNFLKDKDLLIGPTADDRMFNTLEEFFDGDISLEKTLEILNCMNLSKQYLIKSQLGVERLNFLDSYYLEGEAFESVTNENIDFMNNIKQKVKMYQRKTYDNEKYIEDIQEVINHGLKQKNRILQEVW